MPPSISCRPAVPSAAAVRAESFRNVRRVSGVSADAAARSPWALTLKEEDGRWACSRDSWGPSYFWGLGRRGGCWQARKRYRMVLPFMT